MFPIRMIDPLNAWSKTKSSSDFTLQLANLAIYLSLYKSKLINLTSCKSISVKLYSQLPILMGVAQILRVYCMRE